MIFELKSLHSELLALLHQHELLCDQPVMDRSALGMNRWRMAALSRQKQEWLSGGGYDHAERSSSVRDRAAVRALKDTNASYRAALSAYVSKWTIDAIAASWAEYRVEAKALRDMIRERIRSESAILYPILP